MLAMLMSNQMLTPSKRFITMASALLTLLVALAWGVSRLLPRARSFEGVHASIQQKADGSRPAAESRASDSSLRVGTLSDSDNDGIPDAAELHTVRDRDSFRQWFTSIAENQFYQLSDQWNAEQRDCAGLVRFATREALRRHDRIWFQKMGRGYETVAPDVAGFDLAKNPLGERIFRTDFGTFQETDLHDGKFSEFADGRSLKNYN